MSIILAAGAFVVSLASLWFAALRRADVTVDRIAAPHELRSGGWKDGMVEPPEFHLRFYLANTGASGTVIESFEVTDFAEDNDGPVIWTGMVPVPWDARLFAGVDFPKAMERDDATTGEAKRQLVWNDNQPIPDPEELARRVARLRSVSVTFKWKFRRSRLLRSRQHETVHRHEVVTVDAAPFRQECIDHWRSQDAYRRLAELAEGREPA